MVPASIRVVEPRQFAVIGAPADIALTAIAAENEEPAEAVNFFAGDRLVGSAATSPFGILWTNVPSGSYLLTAVMTNRSGNAVTSAPVRIVVNSPPTLDPIADGTIDEGQQLLLTAVVSDPDLPAQTLTFSLGAGAPMGATINATNGVITWTPEEAQGPGTYSFVVRVTDDAPSPRIATRKFAVTVNEINRPPLLEPVGQQTVTVGKTLVVTNIATDPDLPVNRLVFDLGPGAPAGSAIDPQTGRLTWTVPADGGPGTNMFTVHVTDNGTPPLSAEMSFTVGVVAPLQIERVALSDQTVTLTWRSSPGKTYQVEYKTDLRKVSWNTFPITIAATNHHATFVDTLGAGPLKFYRIVEALDLNRVRTLNE
jgi:hypothetical protein